MGLFEMHEPLKENHKHHFLSPDRNMSDIALPPRRAHCPAWRLAPSPLYEWMGVALGTGNEAVVTALADRRWRAVWVKAGLERNTTRLCHRLGETTREGKGRRGERDSCASPLPGED